MLSLYYLDVTVCVLSGCYGHLSSANDLMRSSIRICLMFHFHILFAMREMCILLCFLFFLASADSSILCGRNNVCTCDYTGLKQSATCNLYRGGNLNFFTGARRRRLSLTIVLKDESLDVDELKTQAWLLRGYVDVVFIGEHACRFMNMIGKSCQVGPKIFADLHQQKKSPAGCIA